MAMNGLKWGEKRTFGGVTVGMHPAGHVAGSAQIRVDDGNEVWVVTGDYKRDDDPSCEPFEVVPCDVLITEATFALPVYCWPSGSDIARHIYTGGNSGRTAQFIIRVRVRENSARFSRISAAARSTKAGRTTRCISAWSCHRFNPVLPRCRLSVITNSAATIRSQPVRPGRYRRFQPYAPKNKKRFPRCTDPGTTISRSPWMKRFQNPQTAFASGWMLVRGARRRRGYERGFVYRTTLIGPR